MRKYGKFRLDSLFDHIVQGRRLKKEDHVPGNFPFVMSGVTNTGLVAHIGNPINRFPANSITIDIFGNAFYRGYEFSASDDVGVYWSDKAFSREVMIYICATIGKQFAGLYSYGKKLRSSQSGEIEINLPVNDDNELDFAYMGSYIYKLQSSRIHELQATRIRELQAYLHVTGLSDYILNEKELQFLLEYRAAEIKYKAFRLGDLFMWQSQKEIRPLDIDKYEVNGGKLYPFYGQSKINNGIISHLSLTDRVLNNKDGKPTILIHSNNQNTVYLESPFYLKDGHGATSVLQADFLNKETALFLISCIKKVIVNVYSYNEKATKIALKNTDIYLPVGKDDNPNYEYMSAFVRIQQKLAIKNVIEWKDRELAAYQLVVAG